MPNPVIWTIVGVLLTIATMVATVVYKAGHLSARVEALELWRNSIRGDMHEISDRLEAVSGELSRLATLIEERTDRRGPMRT